MCPEQQPDSANYRTLMYYQDLQDPRRTRLERYREEELDPVGHFTRAALYAGIQSPLDGVRELTNKLVNRELLPEISIISPPQRVDRWTNLLAQKFGGAAGMIPLFLLLNKGVAGAGLALGLVPEAAALTIGSRAALAGASGFLYGGVFQPTAANPESKHDFWRMRLDNAVTNAATFATGSYVHGTLNRAVMPYGRPFLQGPLYPDVIRNTLAGGLSGTVSGIVHAEVGSIMGGTGLASFEQLASSVSDFAIIGAGMGAVNGVLENRAFNRHAEQRMNASSATEILLDHKRLNPEGASEVAGLGAGEEVPLDGALKNGISTSGEWNIGREADGRLYVVDRTPFPVERSKAIVDGRQIAVPRNVKVYLSPADRFSFDTFKNIEPRQDAGNITVSVNSPSLAFEAGAGSFDVALGRTGPLADMLPQAKYSSFPRNILLGRDSQGHFLHNLETDPTVFDFVSLEHKPVAPGQKVYIKPGNSIGVWHNGNHEAITVKPK